MVKMSCAKANISVIEKVPELSLYGNESITLAFYHPKLSYGDPTIDHLNICARAFFHLFDFA